MKKLFPVLIFLFGIILGLINIEITYNVNGKTFIFNGDYISNYLMEDENGCYISDKCTSDFVNKMNSELTTMGITRKFTTTLGKD